MIIDTVKTTARKGALAYVGAWALASDYALETVESLAQRGEKAEQAARQQLRESLRAVRGEARAGIAEGEQQLDAARDEAQRVTNRISDRVVDALNIPRQDDIKELDSQVARLTVQIDQLRANLRRNEATLAEPMLGYEKLTADEVIARLPDLDITQLLALRAHEQQHANRVTVLRATEHTLIERHAAAGTLDATNALTTVEPLPGYAKLTAEEAIERLQSLNETELLHVKTYEQEYLARVTIVRAADERLAEKQTA